MPTLGVPPEECEVSRTATTTMTATAAAAAVAGQRHRRNDDGGLAGGIPPVPPAPVPPGPVPPGPVLPGMPRPAAVTAPDLETRAVSGRRLLSALVAAIDSGAASAETAVPEPGVPEAGDAGVTGARTVGS